MSDMNRFMKKMYLGGDARSNRGILARGKNVYGAAGMNAPKTPNLQKAAMRRLKGVRK